MALIVCSWSGGIDSTALIAQLLSDGHSVHAVSYNIYGGAFGERERNARATLFEAFCPLTGHNNSFAYEERDAEFLWHFSADGIEIPRRNRLIIDHLITHYGMQTKEIGLGEYIGADTWVVRDHVSAADADARALASYVYREYGLDYRLWTLSDFGEARYKHERLRLGTDIISNGMASTTNCLGDYEEHCGRCYKCIERAAAFTTLGMDDPTKYTADPCIQSAYPYYRAQMQGERMPAGRLSFDPISMPTRSGAAERVKLGRDVPA